LVNVLSPSTHLSQAAGAAKPIIPVLAKGEGGIVGGRSVHEVSIYPQAHGMSTGFSTYWYFAGFIHFCIGIGAHSTILSMLAATYPPLAKKHA
jgi:hypothetical protein